MHIHHMSTNIINSNIFKEHSLVIRIAVTYVTNPDTASKYPEPKTLTRGVEGWGCTGATLGQPHRSAGGTHSPPKHLNLSRTPWVLGVVSLLSVPCTAAFFLAVLPAGRILTPVVVFLCRLRGPHPQSFPISVFLGGRGLHAPKPTP